MWSIATLRPGTSSACADGRLTLLDWEWAVEKSLPWQDMCRYFYIQDVLFHGPGTSLGKTLTTDPLIQEYMQKFAIPSGSFARIDYVLFTPRPLHGLEE